MNKKGLTRKNLNFRLIYDQPSRVALWWLKDAAASGAAEIVNFHETRAAIFVCLCRALRHQAVLGKFK